jgi:hypothetical protein
MSGSEEGAGSHVQRSTRDPEAILAMVAEALPGVSRERLAIVRVGTHVVVRSSQPDLILRVDCPALHPESVESWNRLLTDMARSGAPIVPPLQAAVLDLGTECAATLWPLADTRAQDVRIGVLIRNLHDSEVPVGLPQWDFESARVKILDRLAMARDFIPADVDETLESRVNQVFSDLPEFREYVLTHGDAHAGNIVRLHERPVFVDLDDLSLAPRELDLAPSVVTGARFKGNDWAQQVLDDYGRGQLDEYVLRWFASLREVTMNSWLATLWRERPDARSELLHRIATWEGGGQWHPM